MATVRRNLWWAQALIMIFRNSHGLTPNTAFAVCMSFFDFISKVIHHLRDWQDCYTLYMSFGFFVMITLQLTLNLPFEAGRLPRFFCFILFAYCRCFGEIVRFGNKKYNPLSEERLWVFWARCFLEVEFFN